MRKKNQVYLCVVEITYPYVPEPSKFYFSTDTEAETFLKRKEKENKEITGTIKPGLYKVKQEI